MRHVAFASLWAVVALALPWQASWAQNFADVATISATMGVQPNRVCVGETTRGDIGCPTYAPRVGPEGGVSLTSNLDVSGTVRATQFVGDGSGLSGVIAAGSDRITSGTTSFVVVSSTGYISLTQGGTNTGWFDPTRGLVTLGVSATGGISGTTGYFTTNVYTRNSAGTTNVGLTNDGALEIFRAAMPYIDLKQGSDIDFDWRVALISPGLNFYVSNTVTPVMSLGSNGNVGIGTSNTSVARLDVAQTALAMVGNDDGVLVRLTPTADGEAHFVAWNNTTGAAMRLAAGSSPGSYNHLVQADDSHIIFEGSGGGINSTGNLVIGPWKDTAAGLRMLGSNGWVALGGIVTPTTPLHVSGTVTATRFVGDGSGLTGVIAAGSDRITSGTTSFVVVSGTGYISLTQGGTNTGWFDPTRGLVTLGVSATGGISGTTGYFAGNVGIGTSSPNQPLTIENPASAWGTAANIRRINNTRNAALFFENTSTPLSSAAPSFYLGLQSSLENFAIWSWDGVANQNRLTITPAGNVGIGTSSPNQPLTIENPASAWGTAANIRRINNTRNAALFFENTSTPLSSAAPSFYLGLQSSLENFAIWSWDGVANQNRLTITPAGNVGIGMWNPNAALDVYGTVSATNIRTSGTVWATQFVGDGSGLTGVIAAGSDRITSGTTSFVVVSSTGYISLTQGGTNTGWFDPTRGLVTLGVSATGGISGTTGYFAGNVVIGDPYAITSGAKTLRVYSDGPSTSALGIAAIEIESVNNNALLIAQNSWNGTGGTQLLLLGDGGIRLTRPTDATDGDVNGYIDFSTQNLAHYGRFEYDASAGTFNLINTSNTAKLYVESSVRIGNDTGLCDGNNPGTIRYNAGNLQVCNGSSWGSVGSGTEIGDRISSTNNMAAVVATEAGTVSFTLGGTAGRAYLDTTLGLVAPGVSTTGGISATTGYFAGNVGIGTSSPGAPLHVRAGADRNFVVGPSVDVSAGVALSVTNDAGSANMPLELRGAGLVLGAFSNQAIRLQTQSVERMRITENGWVGIGTQTPLAQLHLSGNGSQTTAIVPAANGVSVLSAGANQLSWPAGWGGGLVTWDMMGASALFSGFVGIGLPEGVAPSSSLHVGGVVMVEDPVSATGGYAYIRMDSRAALASKSLNIVYGGYGSYDNVLQFDRAGNNFGGWEASPVVFDMDAPSYSLWMAGNGNVGMGTWAPITRLDVSGSLRIADGGEACASSTVGAIRYSGGGLSFCNGAAWTTLAAGGSVINDRIVGSNANVVAGGGMVSISTGGVSGTAYFDTAGRLVAAGVSSTGGISGTTGYFSGGLRINSPTTTLAAFNVHSTFTTGNNIALTSSGDSGQAWMIGKRSNTVANPTNPNSLFFAYTADNGGIFNVPFTLTSAGVGIGPYLDAPSATLHVSGTILATKSASSGDCDDATDDGKMRRNVSTGRYQYCRWTP